MHQSAALVQSGGRRRQQRSQTAVVHFEPVHDNKGREQRGERGLMERREKKEAEMS
jgi:hypothetical protein